MNPEGQDSYQQTIDMRDQIEQQPLTKLTVVDLPQSRQQKAEERRDPDLARFICFELEIHGCP